jgi:outer membrane protein
MRPLIVVLVWCPLALAQNTLQLSLKRAVEIALTPEGSTRVALAQQSMKQAEQKVVEARGAFLPNVDGAVDYRDQTVNLQSFGLRLQSPIPGFQLPTFVGPFTVFDARLSAQQSVFSFSDVRKYQASKASLKAINSDYDATRDQVSDQVARAYLGGLRADAALDTAKANVELSQALVKLAQNQKAAGTGTGIEVTRAQVQLANDQQRLLVAQNDRTRAILELLRAMNLNLDAAVELSDKLSYRPVPAADVQTALETARQRRNELKAQLRRQDAAKLSYDSVSAERLPSVAAFGDYGSNGTALLSSLPTRQVGLALKVPIFDGFRRNARRTESFSQYRQQTIHTHDLEQQIELDVRLALDSLKSAQAQVETARDGLALAQNELAQAQRRYRAGVTTSLEVTDAQTRLDRARDNQIQALYNYNLAHIDLATATGTIGEYVNQ